MDHNYNEIRIARLLISEYLENVIRNLCRKSYISINSNSLISTRERNFNEGHEGTRSLHITCIACLLRVPSFLWRP